MPVLVLRLTGSGRPGRPGNGHAPTRRRDDGAVGPGPNRPAPTVTLDQWAAVVGSASDPCLVLDPTGRVVAASTAAAEVLGVTRSELAGAPLLSRLCLLDFDSGQPTPGYAERIPPVGVLGGQGLMRSLLRLRHRDGRVLTVDAMSTALHDSGGHLQGSLTFLSVVTPG